MFRFVAFAIAFGFAAQGARAQSLPITPGVDFCQPGVSGVIACPCANPPVGTPEGCDNSRAFGGAVMTSSGVAIPGVGDTLTFTISWTPINSTGVLFQGTAPLAAGVTFGAGVRCIGGTLKRLYVHSTTNGTFVFGHLIGTDPDVHVRSAALGDTISAGTHRYYQVAYRDPAFAGCSPPVFFNISQAQDVLW